MKSIALSLVTAALLTLTAHGQAEPPRSTQEAQPRQAAPPAPPTQGDRERQPVEERERTPQPPRADRDLPPPPPPPAPPPPGERRPLPTRNVKVDVTITEQSGTGAPMKKLVSFVVADGRSSGVRSTANVTYSRRSSATAPSVYNQRALPLNVDSTVTVTPDQRVLLELRFNYGSLQPMVPLEKTTVGGGDSITTDSLFGEITENLSVLLTPGAPVVISRSADATSDRTVTVEVKAEILK